MQVPTLKFLYDYVTADNKSIIDPDFISGAISHVELLAKSFVGIFISFAWLILYSTVMGARILYLIFPYLIEASKWTLSKFLFILEQVIIFHRTKLDTFDIIIEMLFFAFLIISLLFRKQIMSLWSKVIKSIEKQSKIAAKIAPFALFFAISLLVSILGRSFLSPLASNAMPLFTIVFPCFTTIRTLSVQNVSLHYSQNLTLWIVVAFYHIIATLLSLLPFFGIFYKYLPWIREFILVVFVGVQLFPVCTDIVHSTTMPMVHRLVRAIPIAEMGTSKESAIFKSILDFLQMIRLISDGGRQFINEVFITFPHVLQHSS